MQQPAQPFASRDDYTRPNVWSRDTESHGSFRSPHVPLQPSQSTSQRAPESVAANSTVSTGGFTGFHGSSANPGVDSTSMYKNRSAYSGSSARNQDKDSDLVTLDIEVGQIEIQHMAQVLDLEKEMVHSNVQLQTKGPVVTMMRDGYSHINRTDLPGLIEIWIDLLPHIPEAILDLEKKALDYTMGADSYSSRGPHDYYPSKFVRLHTDLLENIRQGDLEQASPLTHLMIGRRGMLPFSNSATDDDSEPPHHLKEHKSDSLISQQHVPANAAEEVSSATEKDQEMGQVNEAGSIGTVSRRKIPIEHRPYFSDFILDDIELVVSHTNESQSHSLLLKKCFMIIKLSRTSSKNACLFVIKIVAVYWILLQK
ncbi:hypothetical protein BSLG_006078 [Batrachochytrium salamandrivorans]|nr:hypothetical protein BSLG_006078 [Batrachochytrium salamandrivorans]